MAYPDGVVEGALKVQEVIVHALAGKLTRLQAAAARRRPPLAASESATGTVLALGAQGDTEIATLSAKAETLPRCVATLSDREEFASRFQHTAFD